MAPDQTGVIRLTVAAAVVLAVAVALVFTDRTRAAAPAEVQPRIQALLTPSDIRRVLLPSAVQRKRILRAHPHFGVYKEAKRRHGISWFLLAAVHARHRAMDGRAVMSAARRLRRAGAGPGLGASESRALTAYYGASPAGRTRAARVLAQARMWRELGIIALPPSEPLVTPVHGVVPPCGHFHCPRPGHFHNGIDVLAPTGTPVRAMQTGRVAVLKAHGGYGLLVCLQHSERLASCYAHLSRFAEGLAIGGVVTRGQLIGRVGCTGACTGPHLHFEIRRGAAPCSACAVDPVPYLEGDVPHVPPVDLTRRVPAVRSGRPAPAPAVVPGAGAPAPAPAAAAPLPSAPVTPAPAAQPEPPPGPAPGAAPKARSPAAPTGGTGADAPLPTRPSAEPGRTGPPPTGGASAPPAP